MAEWQRRLSADDQILIGVHGNGLTHTLWQQPSSSVIELQPRECSLVSLLGSGATSATVLLLFSETHDARVPLSCCIPSYQELTRCRTTLLPLRLWPACSTT